MITTLNAVRVALFALSLLLLESGGQTLLTTVLTFAGDMSVRQVTALISWSATYVVLGGVALFTAFKVSWLPVFAALPIAAIGIAMSAWNALAINCSTGMVGQDSFLLLGCVAHPAEYAGLCTSLLLLFAKWLRRFGEH